jgi:hypothetical protein
VDKIAFAASLVNIDGLPQKIPPKNSLTRVSGYSKRNYSYGRKGLMNKKQLTFWGWWWWNERGGEVCP